MKPTQGNSADEGTGKASAGAMMNANTSKKPQPRQNASAQSKPAANQQDQQDAKKDDKDDSATTAETGVLPTAFATNLPPESREKIERAIKTGRDFIRETRSYIGEYPAEAAGLIACAGAVAWALLGTKPGRKIVEMGSPHASKWLADNLNSTFRGEQQLQ